MAKHLVIVESPAKAKTIEKYLGKDYTVLSSVGHIRSIVKKTKDGTPPIDVTNGFATQYQVDSDKRKVVTELKKAAKAADTVYLATDPDREGEAIAWHLCEVLGLDPTTTKRITYHEISRAAVEAALANAHTVDMNLVRAQQARQILDRLVGFELSPVVWQKVPGGKSAGRVQSPAVRLLVEREREIAAFSGSSQFKVTALFTHQGSEVAAELRQRFDTEAEAQAFLEQLIGAHFTITDVQTTPGSRSPSAPFTTSTLQQDANAKLGFGSKATMATAQKLYQDGKITYMRTDSVNLSSQARASTERYITSTYGSQYAHSRAFRTKAAGAQEAHEAIRPTDISLVTASQNEYDQKLYDLIRRRTLASQMAPAKLERTTITIAITSASGQPLTLQFEAKGEVVIFDGFLKVYGGSKKEAPLLPAMHSGQALTLQTAHARQVFARPPARYTEGSLVKKLEDLGIGRPSTYATIIDTIQTRGYVERGESEGQERQATVLTLADGHIERSTATEKTGATKGKLVPTPSGELIADFLTQHFTQVVDYDFTANVEEEFDAIAADTLARNTMLERFYTPFHKLVEASGSIDRSTVGAHREVGQDPKTGKPIIARFGRFGPMLQLGSTDSDDKPQFAPLPAGTKIETVTLEEALHMFKLPRLVGQTEDGQDIKANIGRFGPYIQVGKLFVSIKPEDPHTISLETARTLYAQKLAAEAAKNIADFGDGLRVLNGRFGPYVTNGTKNVKIPKGTDPATITKEQAATMIAEAPAPRRRRTTRTARKAA